MSGRCCYSGAYIYMPGLVWQNVAVSMTFCAVFVTYSYIIMSYQTEKCLVGLEKDILCYALTRQELYQTLLSGHYNQYLLGNKWLMIT